MPGQLSASTLGTQHTTSQGPTRNGADDGKAGSRINPGGLDRLHPGSIHPCAHPPARSPGIWVVCRSATSARRRGQSTRRREQWSGRDRPMPQPAHRLLLLLRYRPASRSRRPSDDRSPGPDRSLQRLRPAAARIEPERAAGCRPTRLDRFRDRRIADAIRQIRSSAVRRNRAGPEHGVTGIISVMDGPELGTFPSLGAELPIRVAGQKADSIHGCFARSS